MKSETLDSGYAADLIRRQQALQSEGAKVLEDLSLLKILSRFGTPQQIGSFASGLMVWRDIDVHVVAPGLSASGAFEAVREFAAHPQIQRIRYMNESGRFNPTGELRDERYYFGMYYAPDQGEEWKIDVSFWLKDVERSEIDDVRKMRQLTPELRLLILWIKDVWHRLPSYRTEVFSTDIYDAVLEHGIKTPAEFDRYLAERGRPPR